MGFRATRRTFRIYFDEKTAFDGLEFRAYGVPIGAGLDILHGSDKQLVEAFAENLIEWNYEDETGVVIPCEHEPILELGEADVVATLAWTWIKEVTGVRGPLGKRSSSSESTIPPNGIPQEAMLPTADSTP